jgi:hypothetical protein
VGRTLQKYINKKKLKEYILELITTTSNTHVVVQNQANFLENLCPL